MASTHSDHLMMEKERRDPLLDEVRCVIHDAGGTVDTEYTRGSYLAQKAPA